MEISTTISTSNCGFCSLPTKLDSILDTSKVYTCQCSPNISQSSFNFCCYYKHLPDCIYKYLYFFKQNIFFFESYPISKTSSSDFKRFKLLNFKSPQEFISFGDRLLNLLTFI